VPVRNSIGTLDRAQVRGAQLRRRPAGWSG
jgi:hypothetical protein